MVNGLTEREVDALSVGQMRDLVAWTLSVSGGVVRGEVFVPQAVRRLPLEERLHYAVNPPASAAWQETERRAVVASPVYFTEGYGHVQPRKGPAIPFELWPLVERAAELAMGARTQGEVLAALWREQAVLMLKARQLGMTWLVLHYAYWIVAFRADTPNARVLALSKVGGDASKLLQRARRIRELLPPFLRHEEDPETRGSKSELGLVGRGSVTSLTSSPEAARMETATFVMVDEAAFIRNGGFDDTMTALEPTVGDDGQLAILSTGNGETGDGAGFAREVRKALRGEGGRFFVFLPSSTAPGRDEPWRKRTRRRYRSDEKFEQEYPENVEQALSGEASIKVYPTAHIAAAVRLGKALAALDGGRWIRDLVGREGLEWGLDWGDFQTHCVWGAGLPSGGPRGMAGLLLTCELVQALVDPDEAAVSILSHRHRYLGERPRFVASRADSNPPGNNKIFARRLRARREREPGWWPEKHMSVPFGVYKEGGSGKRGVNTVAYLQALLKAAHDLTQQDGWDRPERLREVRGALAILPKEALPGAGCPLLVEQMRNLEKDPETGRVRKPDANPRQPERGDHGPDGVIALAYRRAEKWTATAGQQAESEEAPA